MVVRYAACWGGVSLVGGAAPPRSRQLLTGRSSNGRGFAWPMDKPRTTVNQELGRRTNGIPYGRPLSGASHSLFGSPLRHGPVDRLEDPVRRHRPDSNAPKSPARDGGPCASIRRGKASCCRWADAHTGHGSRMHDGLRAMTMKCFSMLLLSPRSGFTPRI